MKDKLHKVANRKFKLWYLVVLAIILVITLTIVSTSCSDVSDEETGSNSSVSNIIEDTTPSVNEETTTKEDLDTDNVASSSSMSSSVPKPQSENTIVSNKNNVVSGNNNLPEVSSPSVSDNNNVVEDNNKNETTAPDESDKDESNSNPQPDDNNNQPDEDSPSPPENDNEEDDEIVPEEPVLNLIPEGGRLILNGTTYIGDGKTVEWPDMSGDTEAHKDTSFTYKGMTYKIYYSVLMSEHLGMGWILNSKHFASNLISSIPTEWNGIPVTGLQSTFQGNPATEGYPEIPKHIIGINRVYANSQISTLPVFADGVKGLYFAFSGCFQLTNIPDGWELPESVENIAGAFQNCTSLTGTMVINGHPTVYRNAFQGVDFGLQNLTISHTCDNEDCDLVEKLMATGKNTVATSTLSTRQTTRSLPSFSFAKLFKFFIAIPTRIKLFF